MPQFVHNFHQIKMTLVYLSTLIERGLVRKVWFLWELLTWTFHVYGPLSAQDPTVPAVLVYPKTAAKSQCVHPHLPKKTDVDVRGGPETRVI